MKWLPPVTAADAGPGLAEQAAGVYARVPADAVHVTEYVTTVAADSYAGVAAARVARLGSGVAATTVVVPTLFADGALVAVEAHAGADDGVVFLPTVLPSDTSADLRGQTEQVFEAAAELLVRQGMSMADVVLTVDHTTAVTRLEYPRTGRVRRTHLSAPHPGAAGILQDRMLDPAALIALDVVASRHPLATVNPGWARYETLTYQPGVTAGPMLFLAGQGALDVETEQAVHAGDLAAQTAFTYRNILRVLAADGLDATDLVHVTEYLTPEAGDDLAVVDAARDEVLGGVRPVTTRIGCAGLLRPEFLIEVIPVARRRG